MVTTPKLGSFLMRQLPGSQVIYHLETYEPELIRSSIPNYFLAKLASEHTKVVLTGEGADELFAGYLYFKDSPSREMLHDETLRIWDHLHNVNLQVPFKRGNCTGHSQQYGRSGRGGGTMAKKAFRVLVPLRTAP